MTLSIQQWTDAPPPALADALEQFEWPFQYPLGPGRWFRIAHGRDYPRFFRAMGEGVCFVAIEDGKVLGVIGAALRPLAGPDGTERSALYIGDLKIAEAARGGRVLWRLAQAVQQWAGSRVSAAYAVVMDGTRMTPETTTGRLGLPHFVAVGQLVLLRITAGPGFLPRADAGFPSITAECGLNAYRRLSQVQGRYAPLGGDSRERSILEPVWWMTESGSASGCVEDTRRAKRLMTDAGSEMLSAHVSSFAYADASSAAEFLQGAFHATLARGLPALFVAVPAPDAAAIRQWLPG
ncbi:MAG: GNAT family N-acetyltransferase, partial [Gemmataceae bacterium]